MENPDVNAYVNNFSAIGMKGEARNKVGRVFHPLFKNVVTAMKYGMIGLTGLCVAQASITGILPIVVSGGMAAALMAGQKWEQGQIKYLQNVALRNAGLLNRKMQNENMSSDFKKQALDLFLKKQMPILSLAQWHKDHPAAVNAVVDSKKEFPLNNNFVSVFWNTLSRAERKNHHLSFKDRMIAYADAVKIWNNQRKSTDSKGLGLQEAALSLKKQVPTIDGAGFISHDNNQNLGSYRSPNNSKLPTARGVIEKSGRSL